MDNKLVVISHPDCLLHDTKDAKEEGVFESPARLRAVLDMLATKMPHLPVLEATPATNAQLNLAHPQNYIDTLEAMTPASGSVVADKDREGETVISPGTMRAARLSAGAGCMGVDMVVDKKAQMAFCAVRPPGHHAESETVIGFCFYANAYIAARHAQQNRGVKKVAIIDFDVHHGNGTAELIYKHLPDDLFFVSSHQHPFWPNSGDPATDSDAHGRILNIPLAAGTTSKAFRAAYEAKVLPALKAFAPDMLIISAGFDAHDGDPLADIKLQTSDYAWLSTALKAICPAIVSLMEGGYSIDNLINGLHAHLSALEA